MGEALALQLAAALGVAAGSAALVLGLLASSRRQCGAAWGAVGWILGLGIGAYLGWLVFGF
jgi:hypothetical protein